MRNLSVYILVFVAAAGLPFQAVYGFTPQSKTAPQATSAAQVMERFNAKMEEHFSVEMRFTFSGADRYGNEIGSFEGMALRQGTDYAMINREVEVYAKGDTKWIYTAAHNEAVVMPNDPTVIDLAENPLALLSAQFSKEYSLSGKPNYYVENGREVVEVTLTPKPKNMPYSSIILRIDNQTLTPHSVRYNAKDGGWYEATIITYTHHPQPFPPERFTFSAEDHPGVYITDFR